MESTPSTDRIERLLAQRAWVRRIARALFLDENRAADLEQEVWLDALRAEPPRSPRAWLGTVLRRVAASMRRSDGRRAAHEKLAPFPPAPPDPGEWIEQAEMIEKVVATVRTLAEPYRTTLFLRYFEDLGPAAIAARLGAPVETVRTRLRRGLGLIRRRLDAGSVGDRRSWALLLLPYARPRATTGATSAAVTAGTIGAILMTLKSKAAVAAVVVLLFAGVVMLPRTPPPAAERGEPRVPAEGAAVAGAPASRTADSPVVSEEKETASAPPNSPAPGAVAVGRVLDDATGFPIPRARVSVVFQHARLDPEEEPTAVTDGDGRFRIEGIDERTRTADSLLVLADGYAEHLRYIYGWGKRIREGEPVDLGETRVERGASVTGRVLAADGAPVAGATILFCRDTPRTSPASFTPNYATEAGASDATGRYFLERIPPGKGRASHTVFAVGGRSVGWLTLSRVAGRKDLSGQDVRLRPAACITVTVRDPDGQPLEGARVVAEPHFLPLGARSYDRPVHSLWIARPDLKAVFAGTTDGAGRLRLDRLPVDGEGGSYDVVAYAKGMDRGWKDRVRVAPGETVEVVVDLVRAGTAVLSGTVRNAVGDPVEGAEVNFVGRMTTTDAAGAYRVEGVSPADLSFDPWMTVEAEGYAKASHVFKRPERWDRGGVDFVLERAVPVWGVVVDEEARPLAGVQVTLESGGTSVETVHTGADGRFTLHAGEGRETRLSLYPPRPFSDWLVPEKVPVPADGSEMRVVLGRAPNGTRVVVEVRDAATGQPLDPERANLFPVIRRSGPRVYGTPPRMESGRAVFERVLPGEWILWVGAKARAPARRALRVEKGREEMTVTIRCALPGTVRGRLEGGPPLHGRGMVFLSLVGAESLPQWARLQSDPGLIRAAYVETDGSFRIEEALPGRLRIWTERSGFRGETEVEVLAGTEVEAVIRMEATARTIFRTSEQPPLPVVEVRFAAAGEAWGAWTPFVGRKGRLPELTTNVPPGRVRWEARFREKGARSAEDAPAAARGEYEARAGETLEVAIPVR